MNRELRIGMASYSIETLRSMTENEIINVHKNTPQIKSEDIRKAWKAANGLSVPNHLKSQLVGIKHNKNAITSLMSDKGKAEKKDSIASK